jgi:hypothetical protein
MPVSLPSVGELQPAAIRAREMPRINFQGGLLRVQAIEIPTLLATGGRNRATIQVWQALTKLYTTTEGCLM